MKLLDVSELSTVLGISAARLLEKARRGEIPRLKLGKGPKAPVRFDLDEVLKALQPDSAPVSKPGKD